MARYFHGGILPKEEKITAKMPLEKMMASDFVTLPLRQHKGDPLTPLVSVGDRVLKGQKIADGEKDRLCCPIHASVSGTVKAIGTALTPQGEGEAILIENDYKEEVCPTVRPFSTPIARADPKEIISFIREKGIVEMGGSAYPAWAKLSAAAGKVDTLVVNCIRSEPYLEAVHRLLVEKPGEVVGGVKILLRALGCKKAVFALEETEDEAALELEKILGERKGFSIALFSDQYPQGDERLLVRAITGRQIPHGKKSFDLGVAVFGGETCWAVYRSFVTGTPLLSRAVTVGGECVRSQANLLVPLGVSFAQVLARLGGLSRVPGKLVAGGPMTGFAQGSDAVPVTKTVSGIFALDSPEYPERTCIRCGRCVSACPMRLLPLEISLAAKKGKAERLEKYHTDVCNECGICTYVCPAGIPVLGNIRKGKEILYKSKCNKE